MTNDSSLTSDDQTTRQGMGQYDVRLGRTCWDGSSSSSVRASVDNNTISSSQPGSRSSSLSIGTALDRTPKQVYIIVTTSSTARSGDDRTMDEVDGPCRPRT